MPLFNLSAQAKRRNEIALGTVSTGLVWLLLGGFALAALAGLIAAAIHFLG